MADLLDKINDPKDLKKLSEKDLPKLAEEIRHEIIETVNQTGGHLASSLGAVDLTIALHRVFNAPKDKIIWDVGHQAYAHKILTGRREAFHNQRQYKGISGFPNRDESVYDSFVAGHASTSISAAVGMAVARDMNKDDYKVIAVIGDGSITGGMAYEALNNVLSSDTKIIVILNDNGMSISPTTGIFSKVLGKVRFDYHYYKGEEQGKKIFNSNRPGRAIWGWMRKVKRSVKSYILPTTLWENLGLAYLGPVNGHNIKELESAFKKARDYDKKSVLIHVITTKGKGYKPAEDDPSKYHGVSPAGSKPRTAPTYSQVFADTMRDIMEKDDKVVVITPAMPDGNCLTDLQKEFPTRIMDVGICEQHAVTFAAGLATEGIKPVVAIYSTFLQRSFDQIIHDVALQNLPITFAVDRGGIVGDDGKTHQGIFDLSYLSLVPNLNVAAPRDENMLRQLLYTSVYKSNHPMAIRYPRGSAIGAEIHKEFKALPIGKAEVLSEGKDITIVPIGFCVNEAMEASKMLKEKGFDATVIDPIFASPIDIETISSSVSNTKLLLTVEENVLASGFGANLVEKLKNLDIEFRSHSLGIKDEFVEHGPQSILRHYYGIDRDGIFAAALELLSK